MIFSDDSSGGDANGAQCTSYIFCALRSSRYIFNVPYRCLVLVTRNWSPEYLESAIMDLVQRNLGDEDNFEKERIHHVIKSAINIWDFGEFLRNIRDVDRVVFAGISDIDVKSRILFTQILSCILRWKISNTKPGVQCSDTERNVDNPMVTAYCIFEYNPHAQLNFYSALNRRVRYVAKKVEIHTKQVGREVTSDL